MGIQLELLRMPGQLLDQLLADPDLLEEVIFDGKDPDGFDAKWRVDLDKSWHGLHFLLTGSAEEQDSTPGLALLGGRGVTVDTDRDGEDDAESWVAMLTAAQVAEVAKHLATVTVEQLRAAYDADRMVELKLYPDIWNEDQVFSGYLAGNFADLVAFYEAAAADGHAVLKSLC